MLYSSGSLSAAKKLYLSSASFWWQNHSSPTAATAVARSDSGGLKTMAAAAKSAPRTTNHRCIVSILSTACSNLFLVTRMKRILLHTIMSLLLVSDCLNLLVLCCTHTEEQTVKNCSLESGLNRHTAEQYVKRLGHLINRPCLLDSPRRSQSASMLQLLPQNCIPLHLT